MLTSNDLAVLRAALQFADEELSPHGPAAWQPYLLEADVSSEDRDVSRLRAQFMTCRLRYALCARDGTALLSQQLTDRPGTVSQDAGGLVVAVLVPTMPGDQNCESEPFHQL
jgi:hypothetical protein